MTADPHPDAAPPARKQSLTVSTLWLICAKALSFMLSLALPFFLARRLDILEMGHYKQIFQLIATAGMVLPLGFGLSAFYFFPREPERRPAICINVLVVCGTVGLLGGLFVLLWPGFLSWVFGAPALLPYTGQVAALIPLWIVASLLEVFPVVNQEFRLATGFIVGAQVSRSIMLLAAAMIFGSVRAIVFAAILQVLLQCLAVVWYLESRFSGFWRALEWDFLRRHLLYTGRLAPALLLNAVQSDLHDYIVSAKLGTAIFAVYSIGCVDLPLIGVLLDSTGSVMIGRVSELQAGDHSAEIVALTARVARKLALIFFPVYAFLMVTGKDLIVFWYTALYEASWPIFAVNCTILLITPILTDPISRAYPDLMPVFVRMRVVLFVLMAAALWFLVGRYGPVSAIAIVVCRMAAENIFCAFFYGRRLGMTRSDLGQFRPLLRIAVCSAAAGLITLGVRLALAGSKPILLLTACGLAFCAAYVAAILAMRIPTHEETSAVLKRVSKWLPLSASRLQ